MYNKQPGRQIEVTVTTTNIPVLREIEAHLEQLRRSERKVAELVLARPDEVIHMRIVDLASAAQVSEPTVVRFCRAIGCSGFQSFKMALAQSSAATPSNEPFTLSELDTARDYTYKVFDATMGTLRSPSSVTSIGRCNPSSRQAAGSSRMRPAPKRIEVG